MQIHGFYRRGLSSGRAPLPRVRFGLWLMGLLAVLGPSSTLANSSETSLSTQGFTTDRGILIVDGQFVPPPYRFEVADRELSVNGITLSLEDYDLTFFQPARPSNGMHRRDRRLRKASSRNL